MDHSNPPAPRSCRTDHPRRAQPHRVSRRVLASALIVSMLAGACTGGNRSADEDGLFDRTASSGPGSTAGPSTGSTDPAPMGRSGGDEGAPATTADPPAPPRFDWTRINDESLEPDARAGRFSSIDTIGRNRFVVSGNVYRANGVSQPRTWLSSDGDGWEPVDLPVGRGGGFVRGTTPDGDGLLVVGAKHRGHGPLAWRLNQRGRPTRLSDPEFDGAEHWVPIAVQRFRGDILLWGALTRGDHPDTGASIFALRSGDGEEWREAVELNALLDEHAARGFVEADTGPAGAAAVLQSDEGDRLVVTHTGGGWRADVFDRHARTINDVEVTDVVTLVGATVRRGDETPALFRRRGGRWSPSPARVMIDERHEGFYSSGGDALLDSHLDGSVISAHVNYAQIVAVRDQDGRFVERSFPVQISGTDQLCIADVAVADGVTLGIAGSRAAMVRISPSGVEHVGHPSFPRHAADPFFGSVAVSGDTVVIGGVVVHTPPTLRRQKEQWAIWTVGPGGRILLSVGSTDPGGDVHISDVETTAKGSPLVVGYETFIPSNYEGEGNSIDPWIWTSDDGGFRGRPVAEGSDTVRFWEVAGTGTTPVASAHRFDDNGQTYVTFYRRNRSGDWVHAMTPNRDEVTDTTPVDILDMCSLPGGGAVQFARYRADRDHHRTYVTRNSLNWRGHAPAALNGERVRVFGCIEMPDRVLVTGRVRGEPAMWVTRDGESFRRLELPDNLHRLNSVDVDDDGGIWVLTTRDRIFELGPDGKHRETPRIPAEALQSTTGRESVSRIVVTSQRVVLIGSWEGGLGIWTSPLPTE